MARFTERRNARFIRAKRPDRAGSRPACGRIRPTADGSGQGLHVYVCIHVVEVNKGSPILCTTPVYRFESWPWQTHNRVGSVCGAYTLAGITLGPPCRSRQLSRIRPHTVHKEFTRRSSGCPQPAVDNRAWVNRGGNRKAARRAYRSAFLSFQLAVAQCSQQVPGRVERLRQILLDRPGFAFELADDELGCEGRPHEAARSERERAV